MGLGVFFSIPLRIFDFPWRSGISVGAFKLGSSQKRQGDALSIKYQQEPPSFVTNGSVQVFPHVGSMSSSQ
jgi:hypothetical protein